MASGQSTTNIVHEPENESLHSKNGIGEYLFQAMKKNGDKVAQIDAVTGKEETHAEVLSKTIRIAQGLTSKGVQPGDVVVYCCYNNMDYVATLVAIIFVGARFSSLDVTLEQNTTTNCLKLVKPKIIFCDSDVEDMIESSLKAANVSCDVVVYGKTEKHICFSDFINNSSPEEDFKIYNNENAYDTAGICFTSGTSGTLKAAEMTHNCLYFSCKVLKMCLPDAERIMYLTVPYWVTNTFFSMFVILEGLTRIVYRSFDEELTVKMLQDYKVDTVLFNQMMVNELLKSSKSCRYDTSALKYIMYGGSKMGPKQMQELQTLFPHTTVLNAYGSTEIGAALMFCIIEQTEIASIKEYSIGYPIPGNYYKIADVDTGRALGPTEKGELRIKSKSTMRGYYKEPGITAEAFDEEGYFKTGDIGYYNETKHFFIVDRLKEIFKYKEFHISPIIIEEALLTHKDIKNAAVIGIPKEGLGELPTAVVVLLENVQLTPEDVAKYIEDQLPDRYQLRGGVYIGKTIPLTATGKIRRNYIRSAIINKSIDF